MTLRILRPADVKAAASIGTTAMYQASADGLLPPFFKIIGSRASGMFAHELDEILAARAAGADDKSVREIVSRQLRDRANNGDAAGAASALRRATN